MKHRNRPPEQEDLLRPGIVDLIDMRHELVKLTAMIDSEFFDQEWAGAGLGHCSRDPDRVSGNRHPDTQADRQPRGSGANDPTIWPVAWQRLHPGRT